MISELTLQHQSALEINAKTLFYLILQIHRICPGSFYFPQFLTT